MTIPPAMASDQPVCDSRFEGEGGGVRPRREVVVLAVLGALAFGLPVVGALALADHQARDNLRSRAELYARDVVHRSDVTAQQASDAFVQLVDEEKRTGACSAQQVALMRAIDVSSSYLQAVGRVVGDRLVCSSISGQGQSFDLGPVDAVTPAKVSLRVAARLPLSPDQPVMVLGRGGYAALVHRDLPVDVTTPDDKIRLATVLMPQRAVLASRGEVPADWLVRARLRADTSFFDDGTTVALISSRQRYFVAMAAIPKGALLAEQRRLRIEVGLGGVLMGLGLVVALLYAARKRVPAAAEFRAALRRDEFYLEYQPVMDLRTGACVGAEALLRWRRPDGVPARPDIFVPAAEEAGVIHELTERVCEIVAAEAPALYALQPGFRLSINLSSHDLERGHTVTLLSDLRERLGAAPGSLVAEITERVLVEPDSARALVAALRAHGIGIAVDDFGTGYSSLAYLQTFELDLLKIDKAFVDSLDSMASTSNVVHHIIEMGQALGLRLVAEGVERQEQADYLRARGVDGAQGWLYSRPVSMEQLLTFVSARAAEVPGPRRPEQPTSAASP
jgi:sensor c-di-GMP phosphodiesterase-like protein